MSPLRILTLATLLALTQQPPQHGSVEIRLLDSLTHKGVPAVRVTLVYFAPEPPNDVKVMFTDAEGRVVARNLPFGNYVARMEPEGYRPPTSIPGNDGSSLTFSIRSERPNYVSEVGFIPLGTITGRVKYPNGDPFPNAKVALLSRAYRDGFPTLSTVLPGDTTSHQDETDDRGVFRFAGVSPGEYFVRIANSESDALPRLSYYPGVTEAALAATVSVRGNDISIETQVPQQRAFRISGTVISPTPIVGGSVTLISANPNTLEEPASPLYFQASNPNEFPFEIAGVSSGDYFLFPTAGFGPGGVLMDVNRGRLTVLDNRDLTSKVAIRVVDKDIENLRITMLPAVDLHGKIVVDGDAASVRLESLKIATRAGERSPASITTREVVGVPVSQSGEFTLENLTRDVRLALRVPGLPSDAYVSDIRHAGRSVYAEGFIKAGSSDAAIEIRVDSRGGTISGSVRDISNQPAKQTTVIVVPDAPRRPNPLLYKRVITDANGAFTIRGVAPGEYQLFAWVVAPQGAEEDARFLAPHEGKGTIVRVSPSTQTKTELRLLPQ